MTLRTRLLPSATPGVAWTAQNAFAGVSATGVAGTLSVTTPYSVRPDSFASRLSLTATPGWSTQRTPTVLGAGATGVVGYPEVIWSSAVAMPSNSAAFALGAFYFSIEGATNANGGVGTGAAGTITVNDTVWGSADLAGVASTGDLGSLAVTGFASVILTGPQATSAPGQVFVGDVLQLAACESIAYAGTINAAGFGTAAVPGVRATGYAATFDFESLLLVRAIRITAYVDPQ